jgi:tRNA (pseudouridine54-N1)-methyltransferase
MREFIYYSDKARTSGNFKDLMRAGRLDIACHIIIASFFISNELRKDITLHLIFNGPPDPPKHLEIISSEKLKEIISKKDISGLIKRMLYKYKKGKKTQPFESCFIEKKSLSELIKELHKKGKEIYVLDRKGKDIRKTKINKNSVFILGDQEGIPKKELRRIKKLLDPVSLGPKTYFSSQSLIILQNELDLKEL